MLSRKPILAVALMCASGIALAQVGELPIVKPRERSATEGPKVKPGTRQAANTSTVFVLLNPIVPGKVVVKNSAGKLIKQEDTDKDGQATLVLLRGQSYQIEATSPGYSTGSGTVKPSKAQEVVRVQLNAQSRILTLLDLPAGAEILIDNKPVEQSVVGDATSVAGITPTKHKLAVRHPEYNEYKRDIDFSQLGIGQSFSIPITLEKVARLTIQSVAGAEVLIDGALQGRVPASGTMTILFPVTQIREHGITAEKPGFVAKTIRQRLTPGALALNLDLEPFANPEGASDGFDSLNQWIAGPTWKTLVEANNRKLQVSGPKLGLLKEKIYKDFQAVFTIWMPDGKGVTWVLREHGDGQNYYLFHLAGPRSTTHIPKRLYTYVVRNGKEPEEVNAPTPLSVDLSPNASFLVHVVARGYTIEHSITSNETGEKVPLGMYTDSSPTKDKFLYGHFGFRSLSGEIFVVDDFTIDPSKETVTTRPR